MRNLDRQEFAIEDLISSSPAVSLTDAVVQIAVAYSLSNRLSDSDWSTGVDHEHLAKQHAALNRLALSALPLLAQAAGLDMGRHGLGTMSTACAPWNSARG